MQGWALPRARWRRSLLPGLAGCVLLAACGRAAAPYEPDAAAVAQNNRGVALMGRFDYAAAHDVFAQLAAAHPNWPDLRVNLAIATLNRQHDGDERRALDELDQVLAANPANLRARYLEGLVHLYLGDHAAALTELQRVAESDSSDAYAAYFYAQALVQANRGDEAIVWYKRAVDRDPYLRSGYYGAAQALRRAGRTDEAGKMLEAYERFADNPRAELAEIRYTRMGAKALAIALGSSTAGGATATPRPAGALFLAAERIADANIEAGASLTTADIDGDGDQDLYLANDSGTAVYLQDHDGTFTLATDHALAGITGVRAALWGDIDNDGLLDVYLCRQERNQLWTQSAPGRWEEIAERSDATNGEAQCRGGALFDADQDGDLDVFLVDRGAPDELLNNDLDGHFRALARARGLGGTGAGRQIVATDIDGDRDVDIFVLQESPPHELLLNDRLWQYREGEGYEALRASDALAAVADDVDADGNMELYLLTRAGAVERWQRGPEGAWIAASVYQLPTPPADGAQLALQDYDGDGRAELLVASGAGLRVLALSAGKTATALFETAGGEGGAIPVLLDAARGPALVGLTTGTRPGLDLWRPGPGRYPFLALAFTGKDAREQSMRSNASGIGTRVALRNAAQWSVTDTFDKDSGPGQSLQPLALGLAGRARADYVAVDWSDGVFQTELDLDAGALHTIAETQRQLASCPVLFAWDGSRYAFVSDLLGVGGLGFFVAPGVYGEPRPWERYLLPDGLLQPRDGRFVLKLTEPMEEVAYLDRARLIAYDVPPGWSFVLDERFGIEGPAPTGAPLYYRRSADPMRAVNDRGDDVLAAILDADHQAAPPGALDARFIGHLAHEHTLELDFAAPLDQGSGRPVLAVDGWIEYPYSQTVFAAWQADASYDAPSLETAGADGVWRPFIEHFGYPAGMPRGMALPLDGLPRGTTRLRLRTNMQVYWDRVRVVYAEDLPAARDQVLAPSQARLVRVGFPRRTTGPQQLPDYDYARRAPFFDTRYMAGDYTTFGDVTPLVAAEDDALVIIGPGEETHMEFPQPSQPLSAGWQRRYVLDVRGYAKDMDLYTRDGETVGPLPVKYPDAAAVARREALERKYQLRYEAGP
jgi:tetratricopeptide (TPR) repeat protein